LGGVQVTDGVQLPPSEMAMSFPGGRASVTVGASGPPVVPGVSTPPPSFGVGVRVGLPTWAQAPVPSANARTAQTPTVSGRGLRKWDMLGSFVSVGVRRPARRLFAAA
jgi:hypothetical protein